MRWLLLGLIAALALFVVTGGHVLFLPLFLVLPVGGFFANRRRRHL